VTVIPNAVDVEGFQLSGEPDAALKQKLGLDGKTVLGFVGSFYAYEGLDLLLSTRFPRCSTGTPSCASCLWGAAPRTPT
jgi:glycogen(starch) synthase